jgi:uncharacterized phage protein (TIGR01671 family)
MDRFKFRAWVPGRELMIDADSVFWDGTMIRFGGREFFTADYSEIGEISEVNKCILMQCTGLKDKNGKLIYEGDILRDFYNGHTGPVEWDADYAKFIVAHRKLVVWAFDEGYCTEAWEIIGTIYENPELLESQR